MIEVSYYFDAVVVTLVPLCLYGLLMMMAKLCNSGKAKVQAQEDEAATCQDTDAADMHAERGHCAEMSQARAQRAVLRVVPGRRRTEVEPLPQC